ncbi:MFS transporter [Patescibacteria group bacterium]|nr:MFS transporter [Patescibacteria group bacterium]MBU2081314.1 MFS transporter [Patescibacteria group bacterium]MBU2214659.1 MFS transporter [Patescibacteria group bacterium]MBU2250222.1 MFS transporter [Patescibacteria group bacterium]
MNKMEVKDQKLKSNIWKIYLFEVLAGMFFSVPIMVLFWQDNGLSLTEVMILQSIFAILAVILEVPTGYFADVYGRKKALIIAAITGAIAISAYSLGHNFLQFLIAEVFFALSVSFTSGTISALVYDTLQEIGEEKNYKKVWGNVLFYGMIALALSNILGGFIAKIDLRYALYASIPFFILMIPLAFLLQEPKRHKLIFEKGYLKELLKIIKVALIQNKKLRWIIIYSGVIYAFNQSVLWLYQPYFKLSGLDIAYFGIVFASFQVVAAFSSKYAHKIEEKIGQKYSLAMLIFLVAGSYFLMSNFVFLFSFSFCFIQQFVKGFKNAVITDYINQLTNSSMRATILSAESFVGRLLYATIIPIFGWIADIYTLQQALMVMGATTLISGIIILIILKKDKVL